MLSRALVGLERHTVFDQPEPTPIGVGRAALIQYDQAAAADYDRVFARLGAD
jgi:hypothetical protein